MKQQFLFAAAAIAAMGLASCSNDESMFNEVKGTQVLNLDVTSSGDNFGGTRANRDLYSSTAAQKIDNVKVVIVNDQNEVVAYKLFSDWMNGGVSSKYDNTTFGHGRQASWVLNGDPDPQKNATNPILPKGNYTAYAIGYCADEYTATPDFFGLDNYANKAFTVNNAVSVTLKPATASQAIPAVKEIFAGACAIEVEESTTGQLTYKNFNTTLTLHRQVAGCVGYFKNIPAKGNADFAGKTGAKLRLVAANQNTNMKFAQFNSAFTGTGNNPNVLGTGTNNTTPAYVVNGYNATAPAFNAYFYSDDYFHKTANGYASNDKDAYIVYETTLADWFPTGDTNGDGVLNSDDTWQNKYNKTNNKADGTPVVEEGSVLACNFVIPFEAVAGKATFQLQMLDEDGTIIRYWNVRLADADVTAQAIVTKLNANSPLVVAAADITKTSVTETAANYSVLRNHLYSIGKRNNGDNDDDPNPGVDPDPDDPQDLSNENLILRVNDNWEQIHQMVVD